MKKNYILSGLMLIAALSLASCAKEQFVEQPAEKAGVPFEIVAGVDTKTTTADGTTINWADGDKLNVFHAPAGTTTYGSNDEFTFTSGNNFSGALADGALTEAAYDWYVLYPYKKQLNTPANTTCYFNIGSSGISVAQIQTGYNSKAHLAGQYFPLYGKAENVAQADKPSISLNQALSVIRVTVKNGNDAPLTVSSVSFTAPENIVGSYFINFAGNTPTFTDSDPTYVSKVANLTVKNGTELAKNATADFYIAVKPFTAKVNDDIKLSVNGFERTVKISGSDVTFAPGKIKTLSFNYNYTSEIAEPTSKTGFYRVEDASWLKAGDRVVIVANGFNYALSATQNPNNRAQVAVTKEADGDYAKLSSYSGIQEFVLETGTKAKSFGFWCDNGGNANKYIYAASSSSNYLKSQDALNDNASFTVSVDKSGNATITAQGSNTKNLLRYNDGNSVFSCYGSGQKDVAIYKYYGGTTPTCPNPVISLNEDKVSISVTGGATIYYTTDGSTPSKESTKYTAPFAIVGSTLVKAIAIRSHYNDSEVVSQNFTPPTPTCATPVITGKGTSFEITCATDGATIYYEISTTSLASVATPTKSSAVYSDAVSISATTYVKAYATKDGYEDSNVAEGTCEYSAGTKTATFTFNTDAGIAALGITKPAASNGTNISELCPLVVNGVSMTATNGGTATRVWNSKGTLDLRIYSGGAFTFSVESGKKISSIVLTGATIGGFSCTKGSFSAGSWSGSEESVTLTATGTEKINTITVTYE